MEYKRPLQDGSFHPTSPPHQVPPALNSYVPVTHGHIVNTEGQTVAPVIVPTVLYAPLVGPKPCKVTCISCHAQMVTRVEYTTNIRTHTLAMLLCIVGCLPCMCIPYCVDSCKSANHYCTNCGYYLGKYLADKN